MSFDPINGWRDAQSFPEKMHGLGERNMWIATQDYAAYKADQALRGDSDYRDAGRLDEDDPLSFFSSRAEDQDSAHDFDNFGSGEYTDEDCFSSDDYADEDDLDGSIFGNLDEDDEDDSFSWDEFDAVLNYDPENDFDDDEDLFDDDDDFDSDDDYDDFDY